jgi:hypothetical protein
MGRKSTQALTLRVMALVEAQGGVCAYCPAKFTTDDIEVDAPAVWPTFDHVIPKSKGGRNSIKNGLAACSPCNGGKGNRMPTKKELAIQARILPLALPIYTRLRQERNADPVHAAARRARRQAKRDAKTLRRELKQAAFTPVLHRLADAAYVAREQARLTGSPEPD